MRYTDFKIVETKLREAGEVYVIGDSHAKAMGGTNNLASNGARLTAIATQANSVPNGATVYMTGGHNDVAGGAQPQAIATQVQNIISKLEAKGCTVNYILFPEGSKNPNQAQMGPTRQKITSTVKVGKDLDGCSMQPDGQHCSVGSYSGIVNANTATASSNPGDKQDRDNNVFDMEGGLEAGPPYPKDQVEAIKQLQTELQRLGYSVGSTGIDGKYGPRTSRAVKAFQKDFGQATPPNANFAGGAITADGIKALQSAKPVDKPTSTGNEGSGGGSGTYDLPPLSDRSDVQGALGGVLDFISQYESRGIYDMRNGGTRDRRILDMTIAEVLQYQRTAPWPDGESSAIGRYQYVRATLEWVTGQMGVNRNTQKFDEAFQDRLCIFDARRRCRLDQWLNGSMDSTTFSHRLAQVWSSIPNRNNRSAHLGIGSNRRGINLDQSVAQLDAIRTGLA